jgi:methylated-DNA-[protein]-cysteine S-methyltransferase
MSSFQKKVLQAEYGIPRGWISTYGKIANHIGNINAARAVGRALASNPFPIAIPCHRAIRKNGELGGYQGGVEMKRSLLKMEGIKFTISGRALLDKIYYSN